MSDQTLQEQTTQEVMSPEAHDRDTSVQRSHFYRPNSDIVELQDSYRVQLDVPGTTAEDVEVNFAEGVLSVSAQVANRQQPGTGYLLREYGVADFRRSFQVGDKIDVQRISAHYADGVLTLHLPKVVEVQPRKISVNAG